MIMKYLKLLMEKLPLLTLVVIVGLVLRGSGLVDKLVTGVGYQFAKSPIYTVLMGSESDDTDGQEEKKKEKVPEEEEPVGYVSANEEAERTGKPLDDIIAERKEASNGTYIYADSFPKEARRKVLPAVDYGVANPYYMDPEGTEYHHIDKGVFAQDNDYYAFQEVKDRYFNDALFIGDSQTDGLYNYGLIRDHASFYALEGVTVYNVFDVKIPFRSPTEEYEASLKKVLKKHDYRKIYFCIGMNELGVPATTEFRNEYKKVIKQIRKYQPDAIIYIQGMIHVSAALSMTDEAFNNKNIVQRNEAISKLANGHDIFYIEPSEDLCDGNGDLIAEYTNDNVHLTAKYYPLWHEYLNKYAIVRNEDDK